jgi:hypothetical protein
VSILGLCGVDFSPLGRRLGHQAQVNRRGEVAGGEMGDKKHLKERQNAGSFYFLICMSGAHFMQLSVHWRREQKYCFLGRFSLRCLHAD